MTVLEFIKQKVIEYSTAAHTVTEISLNYKLCELLEDELGDNYISWPINFNIYDWTGKDRCIYISRWSIASLDSGDAVIYFYDNTYYITYKWLSFPGSNDQK